MNIVPSHSAVLQRFSYAGTLLKASRLHYWLKNMLLIVPAILAGSFNSETVWLLSIGYLAFGCAASAHYLFNDFLDRDNDRRDSANCSRPQAMGELQPHLTISLALAFICAATICGSLLPAGFQMTLCCYFGLSVLYSLRLKQTRIVDVMTLVALHDLRLVAGAAAASIPLSNSMLLVFSCFFLVMALCKRIAQLATTEFPGTLPGRAYGYGDRAALLLVAAAAIAVFAFVLAFFLHDLGPQVARSGALWLIEPLLLAWMGCCLFRAHRGTLYNDLVLFVVTDRYSMITLTGLALLFVVAK